VALRETIVVGAVGAGGLGLLLHEQLTGFRYAAALSTTLALIGLTLVVDLLSAAMRRSLA
jgi:phosphonate transport system permease protein